MVTLQWLILAFAAAFTFFIVAPSLLSVDFPPYPSIQWADVLDLLTPLALIPLYWLLFTDSGRLSPAMGATLAFLVLASIWVQGQAMHLGANSISNLMGVGTSTIHTLVHFYDEVLSHYLWHLGIIGLSALLLLFNVGTGAARAGVRWVLIVPASILYGLTYFLAVNEGGTVPLGLPAALVIAGGLLVGRRHQLRTHNLVAFYCLGYAIALGLLLAWGAYWCGFPEFSEVGLL